MPSKSKISEIVAKLIGKLQGELEAKVEGESLILLSNFANQCPNVKKLKKIAKTRNTLLKGTNKIFKVVKTIDGIPKKLRKAISAAKRLIKLLKRNRTKLATGNRPSFSDFDRGGLFTAKTVGFTNRAADRLAKVVKLLEDLEDDLEAVTSLAKSVKPTISKIRDILNKVNIEVGTCVEDLTDPTRTNTDEEQQEIDEILTELNPAENLEAEEFTNTIGDSNLEYRAANGVDYKLGVIQDTSLGTRIPRKVAIAKDKIGVIVLRGAPSFSSDSEILLEELKFRLDNQLA